jgi:hypothetical protein
MQVESYNFDLATSTLGVAFSFYMKIKIASLVTQGLCCASYIPGSRRIVWLKPEIHSVIKHKQPIASVRLRGKKNKF